MKNEKKYCIIIVTFNSQKVIHQAIQAIRNQKIQPECIILVDTGSNNRSYLSDYEDADGISVVYEEAGVGFCRGNNSGYAHVPASVEYVLFLNPDVFLFSDFIEKAVVLMEDKVNCAICTGTLFGYDVEQKMPSGKFDSTGIFRKWFGRWYDRGHGQKCELGLYDIQENVPAICGALMFCRKKALNEVSLGVNQVFDSSFFMYKEDIDLSIRIRRKGWQLTYEPQLKAYHCRGWNSNRQFVKREFRLLSARNDLYVQLRSGHPIGVVYASIKYFAVFFLNF